MGSESIIQHHGNSSNKAEPVSVHPKWLRGDRGWLSIGDPGWLTMADRGWLSIGDPKWLSIPCPMTKRAKKIEKILLISSKERSLSIFPKVVI